MNHRLTYIRRSTGHKRLLYGLLLCLLAFSGCFKEKAMAPPNKQGVGQTNIISMGPDYDNQFFYSLATNQVLASNSRFAYDLMFDCDAAKFHVWLNTAKFMCALKTHKTDLNAVTWADTVNGNWNYERGSYNTDSSALGNWWATTGAEPQSDDSVYIVNLGYDDGGNSLGFVKMQLHNFAGGSYSLSFVSLTGSDSGTITVPKDETRNYRYLAFNGVGQIVDGIEPDKSTWDLCFTHYSTVFYVPYTLPYQVTGVLNNPAKITAYVDSTITYDKAAISNLDIGKLQTNRDAIGYDWKTWTGTYYNTKSYYVFYIQAGENLYYKFHFIGFDNAQGVKGYPAFEYEQL